MLTAMSKTFEIEQYSVFRHIILSQVSVLEKNMFKAYAKILLSLLRL